ncbi:MAG: hypothetical protein SOU95_08740 [Candidatus Cryptobacteroides sp.]|nr:hypothetical protein [Bacteroidales bacterium]MDY2774577.1 hypothetical protein [Candidatus Cryptobacteroides sp.]
MKKFLTISMMALVLVFATSCEKDNEESLDNYVNTWVTDEIPLTEIAGDDITAEFPELPEGMQAVLAQQLANVKLRAVLISPLTARLRQVCSSTRLSSILW